MDRADFEKPIGAFKGNLGALSAAKKLFPFKLGMSIGGWSFSKHFSDAVCSDDRRSIFADGILNLLRNHSDLFDTVDIDWEFIRYFYCDNQEHMRRELWYGWEFIFSSGCS